jgi:hypothetical protein
MLAYRIRRTTQDQTTRTACPKGAGLAHRITRLALMLTVTAAALLAPQAHADLRFQNNYSRSHSGSV